MQRLFLTFLIFTIHTGFTHEGLGRTTNNYNVFWSKTVIREPFSESLGVELDLVVRRQSQSSSSFNLFEYGLRDSVRPWLHWFAHDDFIFSISPMAQFSSRPFIIDPLDIDHTATGELRTTLMGQYYQRLPSINISHRIRVERRDRETGGALSRAVNYRVRYRFRLRYPQVGPFLKEHQWYVRFFNETAIQWGDQMERTQLNQNRIFTGIGYSFPYFYRMELGYINQTRLSTDRSFYDVSQGVMLYIYFDRLVDSMKGKRGPS
jgi:hypothetical protein